MPTVAIEPTLYQRVEQAALESQVSTGELFTQALRRYLWELDRRKIAEESKAYRRQHAELKEHHLGQYIAMHKGRVVDHDPDFQTLRQRVRQQFGRTAVMITLVEEAAEPELTRRGFRSEAGVQMRHRIKASDRHVHLTSAS
jgi:hypothetical protein